MYVKRLAGAAATAAGVGLSALTFGAGLVNAAPSDPPPPCPTCQPGPGGAMTGPAMTGPSAPPGGPATVPPKVGGGPKSGGRAQQPGVGPTIPGA
jgi:hypothetical protein